jgi:hypothetical protein
MCQLLDFSWHPVRSEQEKRYIPDRQRSHYSIELKNKLKTDLTTSLLHIRYITQNIKAAFGMIFYAGVPAIYLRKTAQKTHSRLGCQIICLFRVPDFPYPNISMLRAA